MKYFSFYCLALASCSIHIPFEFNGGVYAANASIGSNSEDVSLQIDCIHNTSIVISNDADCDDVMTSSPHDEGYCKKYGTFDVDDSSTFSLMQPVNAMVNLHESRGNLAQDTFEIAGKSLDDFEFMVANYSKMRLGVLAMGLGKNSFVSAMKDAGYIDKSIVGVTSDGIYGDLEIGDYNKTYDLTTYPVKDGYFKLPLESIDVGDDTIDVNIDALLNFGQLSSQIPLEMLNDLYLALEGTVVVDPQLNYPTISCENTDIEVKFKFKGVTINVPLNSFLTRSIYDNCSLSLSASFSWVSLGQNVLSSAYVVLDLDEEEVSIAQDEDASGLTDYDSDTDDSETTMSSSSESASESSSSTSESGSSTSESSESTSESTSSPSESSSTSSNSSTKLVPSLFSFILLLCI